MSNIQLSCRPLAALLGVILTACGGMPGNRTSGDADPYNGVIDNTYGIPALTGTQTTAQGALAQQFLPNLVPSSANRPQCSPASSPSDVVYTSCYLPQSGFYNGQAISFFNAGEIKQISFGTKPTFETTDCPSGYACAYPPGIASQGDDGSGGFHADAFPHSCTPATSDRVQDAYARDQQFPIANALPLNNTAISSTVRPPLGIVAIYGVTGVTGATCNDLKYASSISNGKLGARRTEKPIGYEVWMVFDPVAPVLKSVGPQGPGVNVDSFWFNGLQANYLSGGRVPLDKNGNLLSMDGIVVATNPNSGGSGSAADRALLNGWVLLPYQPGDDAYSPVVRLHTFVSTRASGFFNAICLRGANCTDTATTHYIHFSDPAVSSGSTATILIAASAQ